MEASLDETIRFCGANRVLMECTHQGVPRLVEVYSYRPGKTGMLLFVYCYKDQKIESFKIENITHAKATTEIFTPRFPIEIT